MTAVSLVGLSRLEFEDVPGYLFRSEDDDSATYQRIVDSFSSEENAAVIVVEAEDFFSPERAPVLRDLVTAIDSLDDVERVISMVDIPVVSGTGGLLAMAPAPLIPSGASAETLARARRIAASHPLIQGQLLSTDGKTTLIIAYLMGRDLSVPSMQASVNKLRALLARPEFATPFRSRVTGIPAIRVAAFEGIRESTRRFTIFGVLVAATVAWLLFRNLSALLIAGIAPMVALLWSLGGAGFLGIKLDIVSSLVPTIVQVIAFSDSVHLVLDFRTSLREGYSHREAATRMLRHLTLACGLTSLTTCVGFASLMVADVDSIRNFGALAAMGSVLAFFAVIVTLPCLAASPLGAMLARACKKKPDVTSDSGFWDAAARPILNHPKAISAVSLLIIAALVALSTRLRPDALISVAMPQGDESYAALMHCDKVFEGAFEGLVHIDWSAAKNVTIPDVLEAVHAAEGAIRLHSDVTRHPVSILAILDSLPEALRRPETLGAVMHLLPEAASRFLDLERKQALVRAHVHERLASENDPGFRRLDKTLDELGSVREGFEFSLSGVLVVLPRKLRGMVRELSLSLALAAVIIFVVMTIGLSSVRLGLLTVLPNVFPMGMVALTILLLDWPLYLGTAMVFSVCLGVAVDDTIHFVAKFRREMYDGHDVRESVRRSFGSIGSALVVTTGVFVAGFSCVLTSDIPILFQFGVLACVGFLAALLGDLIILPALLLVFVPERK